MSTASTVKGPLLRPSFDTTGKPADSKDFICCCGANSGDGSGLDEGQTIEHLSVWHSTESEWRCMRAVVYYWRVSCTSQQQHRQALERQNSGLLYYKKIKYTPAVRSNICRNSSLQAVCDTPIARITGCVSSLRI